MTHATNSDQLALGKTKRQLEERFGFVRTADQVSPYLRDYCAAARSSTDVRFLNLSDYMVIMKQDRAVGLVLCKG